MPRFFAAVISALISFSVHAADRVTQIQVNDFTVYLVDLGKGNQFAYAFSVPYGSADDESALHGRAHWFEHMFSRGSKRFPGHESLIKAMSGYGYQRNASTSWDQTAYFASGNEQHALEALRRHLASIEEPELESSSITREKATVVNEIVVSAPDRPERAIWALPFMHLTEPGHPARGQFTGTAETLAAMNADDLRALHRSIYHAGNLKIAVFANFTSGRWTREAIATELARILPSGTKAPAYVPAAQPPLFSRDQELSIQSEKMRKGFLILPVHPDADPRDVRAFTRAFNLQYHNGPVDLARRQLGWVESLSAMPTRVGPHHLLVFNFNMTKAGYVHRRELAQFVLNSVRAAQQQDFPEPVLDQIRASLIRTNTLVESNIEKLLEVFPDWMSEPGHEAEARFDWKAAARQITAQSVRQGARQVGFAGKAVAFMGPDGGSINAHDDFFRLPFGVRPWIEITEPTPGFSPAQVRVPDVRLSQPASGGSANYQNSQTQAGSWTTILSHRSAWLDRGVSVVFRLGPLDAAEQLSLAAWVFAFRETLQPELAHLRAMGVQIEIPTHFEDLTLTVKGNSGLEFAALEWLISRLRQARPTQELLNRYRDSAHLVFQRAEDGFPGQVSAQIVAGGIFTARKATAIEREHALSRLTLADLDRLIDTKLRSTRKIMAVAGAFTVEELRQLRAAAEKFSPGTRRLADQGHQVNSTVTHQEGWRNPAQNTFGIVRAYPGPATTNLKDYAAMTIIRALLKAEIFLRNRPLGYIQGAAQVASTQNHTQIILYGQANTRKELSPLVETWDKLIDQWLNDAVETEAIENTRQGVLADLSQEQITAGESLEKTLDDYFLAGNAFFTKELRQAAADVTVEEIRAVAKRYLAPDRPRFTLLKGAVPTSTTCASQLAGRLAIRTLYRAR